MPASTCLRTVSETALAMQASNAESSIASPRSFANRKSTTACERGSEPTWVA